MNRRHVAAILLSLSMAVTACLPVNCVGALAAENAVEGITEVTAAAEEEEASVLEEEEGTSDPAAYEQGPDAASEEEDAEGTDAASEEEDAEGSEEALPGEMAEDTDTDDVTTGGSEEVYTAGKASDEQEAVIDEADSEQTGEPGIIIEEQAQEEVHRDAMEYGSDDYPYKNKSYGTYTSADVDPWNYYYREATSFCAWRLNNTNGISFNNKYKGKAFGNAAQWYDAAVSAGITVNKTPALGAVAVWKANINGAGQYGHVAWVCAVSGSNVTVEEYNWGTAGKYNKRTIAASNPSGYIHFKDLAVSCEHSWSIDSVKTAPTATAKGAWLFKCSKCGSTKTTDIPALGSTNLANGKYMILSKLGTDKYVSVTPNQSYQGGNIALYSKGAADQTFTITKNSNGSYVIKYGSFALDVKDQKFSATVQLYQADGTKAQNWYIESAGNGWYRLATQSTYFNMDVANAGTANGTNIGTHWNNGNDAQLFKFVAVTDPVEAPLPASSKVTTTNVASGLKVRWEPVSGAKEYVVYRGSTQIKRTSKTEITDTDVKYDNGKKFTHKAAGVSKTGKISTNVRTSTYYRLLPVGIKALKSPSAGKMTVTYDKNGKGSGYVVRFGLKSDMSDAKVITVKDPAVTTKTFTGLQEGKLYYVQVRSYKIENGIRYYSGYCTTKTVTIAQKAASAQISFSGSQTIAVGTTRRLYVKNAGSASVSVTKSSDAVRISKDSTSYIVTGNKAGSATVTVKAGSVTKSFKITVLSDDQIAQRVYERVLKECPGCRLWDHERDGKTLVVGMHIKSIGEGAIASDIRVNLQTGRAEIDLDQEFMNEWNIGVPKSFMIW